MRAVHLALVCAVWIAIVWLLFASFVATGRDDTPRVDNPATGLRQPLQPGVNAPPRPLPTTLPR